MEKSIAVASNVVKIQKKQQQILLDKCANLLYTVVKLVRKRVQTMSKMSDLALEIEELACAGYDSAEIAEIVNFPVELVESFLEVISVDLLEAQSA